MQILFVIALVGCTTPRVAPPPERGWVATWAASPQAPDVPSYFEHQTLRMIVHASLGGSTARVRLSNRYGKHAVELASVRIGDTAVRFAGNPGVTLAPGSDAVSDPVALAIRDGAELAISLEAPGPWIGETYHALALETTDISPGHIPDDSWYLLAGIDVKRDDAATIVAFGDSITDGAGTSSHANHRWPSLLAARLAQRPGNHTAVIDEGISGNRLLRDSIEPHVAAFFGEAGLARFDRDALDQPGVRAVIVLLGINDIGQPEHPPPADEIIAGLQQLPRRAHARGVKIFVGTLLPFTGAFYYTPEKGQVRDRVNAWIRDSHDFDAVFDFDRALQDPDHPVQLKPAYDSGDHLHPSDAGAQAIADAIELAVLP
jgi:lysophospholipase L1-like esterase